jgi:recombination protein RecA
MPSCDFEFLELPFIIVEHKFDLRQGTVSSERQRKLDAVVARLQLQYGPRAVRKAAPAPEPLPHLSTTFHELDAALRSPASAGGIGGLPRGRITEIVGPATSGKVTLAAKTLAAAHEERDALVAWLDLPRTCDPDYLHRCGLDLDRVLVVRPEDSLDALAITLHLIESDALTGLVFDSLSDLPRGHDSRVAGSLERLATAVVRTKVAVLFLAEERAENQPLAHLAAMRLHLTRERWLAADGDVRGYEAQVEVVKNRLGRAGARVSIRIAFNGTVRGEGL